MAITPQQLIARRQCIGASDAAAIFGLDPFQNASDIWLIKTGRAAEFEGNEATESGNYFEPMLMKYAERKIGKPLELNVHVVHKKHKELQSNLDGLVLGEPTPVEGKSSTLTDEWSDDEDGCPRRTIIQVHFQMECIGNDSTMAYVPRVLPFGGRFCWKLHTIQRDRELGEIIMEGCLDFWINCVKKDTPPENFSPSLEVVKRIKRLPNKVVRLPDEAIQLEAEYESAKAAAKKAKEETEIRQARLIAALGDAEAGILSDGRVVEYATQERAGYTVEATSFRQMRIRKGKQAADIAGLLK